MNPNFYVQVFGYTQDKVLHRIDLPVAQAVRSGIHPWLVDMFEPDPICGEIPHGVPLMFTRLRELSVAYTQEGQGHIATINHGSVRSLSGRPKIVGDSAMCMELDQVQLSLERADFNRHFANYLGFCGRSRNDRKMTVAKRRKEPVCLRATHGTKIKLRNQLIEYADGKYPNYHFAGNMFEPRYFRCSLPVEITRVFGLFARFNPVVFGPALRKALCGRAIGNTNIDILVDDNSELFGGQSPEDCFLEHLRRIGASQIMSMDEQYWNTHTDYPKLRNERNQINADGMYWFHISDTNYRLFTNRFRDQHITNLYPWLRLDFSVNQLHCETPGIVSGSRIALWDLAQRQARLLGTLSDLYDNTQGKHYRKMKSEIRADGIEILDVMWHNRSGQIINPLAALKGDERFLARQRRTPHSFP